MSAILGNCPLCDGSIVQKENSFGCTNAKWSESDEVDELENDGCRYSIHKESLKRYGKRKITVSDIKALFKKGSFVAKLRSKYKQTYYKYILVNEEYGLEVDFDTDVEEKDIK